MPVTACKHPTLGCDALGVCKGLCRPTPRTLQPAGPYPFAPGTIDGPAGSRRMHLRWALALVLAVCVTGALYTGLLS